MINMSQRLEKRNQVGDLVRRACDVPGMSLLLKDFLERPARPSCRKASRRLKPQSEGGLNSRLPTSSISPTSYRPAEVYSGGAWQVAHFSREDFTAAIHSGRFTR